jgi:hypothetical protein
VTTPIGIGNITWAKECVQKGVNVNARLDPYGGNALYVAIEQANFPMIQWLVEELQMDLESVDEGGFNALDYAAACHQHHPDKPPFLPDGTLAPMDIASYLKSKGLKHSWLGAALAEDIDRIFEFLDHGQDINERGGHFNRSAMEEALENGNFWTARLLYVKGALEGLPASQFEFPQESEVKALVMGKLGR